MAEAPAALFLYTLASPLQKPFLPDTYRSGDPFRDARTSRPFRPPRRWEPLRLLFREWRIIPRDKEFRCFIRNRRLVGITQYHYAIYDEEFMANRPVAFISIAARHKDQQAEIEHFISGEILPHLHMDNMVVDLFIDQAANAIKLIEINPYGLSDPCLLSYDELARTKECIFRFNPPKMEQP
jgi:hypothetical protein